MLLAIDIGNSNVVIGCLENNKTKALFRMVTDLKKTEDEYAAGIQSILAYNNVDCNAFEGAIICSVVPPLTEIFLFFTVLSVFYAKVTLWLLLLRQGPS